MKTISVTTFLTAKLANTIVGVLFLSLLAFNANAQLTCTNLDFVAPGNGKAILYFTTNGDGGSAITGYTAWCGAFGQTTSTSPITVSGLTNGIEYACSVIAANTLGESNPSNVLSVTPTAVTAANNELRNISTRADIGNAQAVAVAGFIISGDTEMCVVVRGRGQSVNVNQTLLENPTLTLKSGSTTIEFNDDWQEHPTWATVQALGKAPTEPSESAFHICLDPGAYTAFLRGTIGTTRGIGIIEVIDVDERSSYLFNISTRAQVKTGARRVVAGFIIDGDQPRQVLIRGRGPSVNLNNVTLLADPFIQLRQGPTVVAENDNWVEASNSAEIAATGKAPDNPIESAILITLQPGPYTVFLQGANGEIGLGIIEVLDLTGRFDQSLKGPRVVVGNVSKQVGTIAPAIITLDYFSEPTVVGFQGDISFDSANLKADISNCGGSLGGATITCAIPSAGVIRYLGVDPSLNVLPDGSLGTISFDISAAPIGDYPLVVSGELYGNASARDVPSNGSIGGLIKVTADP